MENLDKNENMNIDKNEMIIFYSALVKISPEMPDIEKLISQIVEETMRSNRERALTYIT